MVFEGLESCECGTASYELVAEAGLVLLEVVILVHLVVGVFRVSPTERHFEDSVVGIGSLEGRCEEVEGEMQYVVE
jgi:hypothetical protein